MASVWGSPGRPSVHPAQAHGLTSVARISEAAAQAARDTGVARA